MKKSTKELEGEAKASRATYWLDGSNAGRKSLFLRRFVVTYLAIEFARFEWIRIMTDAQTTAEALDELSLLHEETRARIFALESIIEGEHVVAMYQPDGLGNCPGDGLHRAPWPHKRGAYSDCATCVTFVGAKSAGTDIPDPSKKGPEGPFTGA